MSVDKIGRQRYPPSQNGLYMKALGKGDRTMAVSEKRKDNRGRILRDGEQQRADGRYMYTYKDPLTRKVSYIYSWELEPHDRVPSGKRTDLSLREKIRELRENERNGILYRGKDITKLKGEKLRQNRQNIQMVFQDPTASFNPKMKIRDIICEPLLNFGRIKKSEKEENCRRLLELVELPAEFSDRYPHNMSGGQRQRVAIARALALEPEVIIMDEATSALDVSVQKTIIELITKLQREKNITIGFICHDIALIEQCAHQIAVMYLGNVVEVLPGGQLSKDAVHPYTRALMGSVFDINMDFSKPIENLEGEAPSPLELPEGCPFQGRCTKCMAICKKEAPQMVSLTPDHQVACHLYTESTQK